MKILFLDIETRPNLAYTWRLYDTNVSTEQLVEEHEILCFSAQWYNDSHILFFSEKKHGERRMVKAAWILLNEADVVVTYSGRGFDLPHLNRKFLHWQLGPPSPYEQIDLKEVMQKQFNFPSNKLEAVAPSLGLGKKVEHEGFRLWRRCIEGDPKAWATMERYNKQDVKLLVQMYDVLIPWIPGHPTRTMYDPDNGECPVCGKGPVHSRGESHTRLSVYRRFQCQSCGTWLRGRKRVRGADLRSV